MKTTILILLAALPAFASSQVGCNLCSPPGYAAEIKYLTADAPRLWRQEQFPLGSYARIVATASPGFAIAYSAFSDETGARLVLTFQEGQDPEAVALACETIGAQRIAAIEGLNEPDLRDESPTRYQAVLAIQTALYSTVRKHPLLSQIPVLGPAFAPGSGGNPAIVGDYSKVCDAGNVHPYYSPLGTLPAMRHNAFEDKIVSLARTVYAGKRLWVTEYGMRTPASSDPLSSSPYSLVQNLTMLYYRIKSQFYGSPRILFNLNDVGQTYGLYDTANLPKGNVQSLAYVWGQQS